jgi:RNA polymerase sigma factor (sigma-70 family)
MTDDAALLRSFAENRSEDAFAEFVHRHIDMVHNAAIRRLGGDVHRAADITQQVFLTAARDAAKLSRHPCMNNWLYAVTRNATLNLIRDEHLRRHREYEAHVANELLAPPVTDAASDLNSMRIRTVLDAALDELSDADRQAVLLRFFGAGTFAEVAQRLQLTQNAARMRVERALEKLRRKLARRGITSPEAALATALAHEGAIAAPAGLAASVVNAARSIAIVSLGGAATSTAFSLARLKLVFAVALGFGAVVVVFSWALRTEAPSAHAGLTNRDPDIVTNERSRAARSVLPDIARGTVTRDIPPDARELYEVGLKLEKEKRYDEAVTAFSQALAIAPDYYDALFSRAGIFAFAHPELNRRADEKAAADYTRALEIDPRNVSARHNRAMVYRNLGNDEAAIADYTVIIAGDQDFSRVVDRDKQVAMAHHYRGQLMQESRRDYIAAIADYTEALRLDPEIDMVLYRRGQTYQALKDYAAAERDFAAAYKRDPDYPNLLSAWAWQLATAPDEKYRDGSAALQLALRANEVFKYGVPGHMDILAAAYAENGRFDDAVAMARQAIAAALKTKRDIEQRSAMETRLALYLAKQPFRDR